MLGGPEVGELVAAVVGDHSSLTGLPLSGADLTGLIGVLEGFDETEDFIDVSADGQVVDGELTEDALSIDDESGSVSNTGIFAVLNKDTVVTGDALGQVGDHGDVHGAETTLLSVLLGVFHMSELGIDGAANQLGTDGVELSSSVVELADLSGANESEVERPEEEHDVLVCRKNKKFVVRKSYHINFCLLDCLRHHKHDFPENALFSSQIHCLLFKSIE